MTRHEALLLLALCGSPSAKIYRSCKESGITLDEFFKSPASFVKKESAASIELLQSSRKHLQVLDVCQAKDIRIITIEDEEYPALLREICDAPIVLYVRGNLLKEDEAAIAVVGSRHPSAYGLRTSHRFAYELAESGLTVVSGLARGVDAEAHRGAIKARGRTLAVLGSSLDLIYPKDNEKLACDILESGALLSEYPPETPPMPHHFPVRNRIISALSQAVLVIEAHERSGSLITASLAAEMGREVYAIPGPIDAIQSGGTNRLIQQGAKLVRHSDEIIDDLKHILQNCLKGWQAEEKQPVHCDTAQNQIVPLAEVCSIESYLSGGPLNINEMHERSGIGLVALNQDLVMLELRGRISRKPGGMYALV